VLERFALVAATCGVLAGGCRRAAPPDRFQRVTPLLRGDLDSLVQPLPAEAHGYQVTLSAGPAITAPLTACMRAFDGRGAELPSYLYLCGTGDEHDRRAHLIPGGTQMCSLFVANATRVARITMFPERGAAVDLYRDGDPLGPTPDNWVIPSPLEYTLGCASAAWRE
jgi:hypothetical protein